MRFSVSGESSSHHRIPFVVSSPLLEVWEKHFVFFIHCSHLPGGLNHSLTVTEIKEFHDQDSWVLFVGGLPILGALSMTIGLRKVDARNTSNSHFWKVCCIFPFYFSRQVD